MSDAGGHFFVVGGTLSRDARCYITRRADADLYNALSKGDFCDVLTSRQMGKSSLMVRTALRLREAGRAVAILDLTALGQNLTPQQWYEGLLMRLGEQLGLDEALEDFWDKNASLAPLQRWMRAVREVALPGCGKPLVIFVDEIDFVRSLPFNTDEFFAAIRECYNRRTEDPALCNLAFCLLGVAMPADLIRDIRTTPFNIGRRIELADFTEQEIQAFAQGLGFRADAAAGILGRVHYWTGGHPYLTQRLCQAVADDSSVNGPAGVDRICEELFLSHRARERDDNLVFVRERLLRSDADRASLLDLYRKVRSRQHVRDDETSSLVGILRLSGITRVREGYLWVRNRIYYRVFDKDWIIANLPDAEKRRQAAAYRRGVARASLVSAIIIAALLGGIWTHYYLYTREYAQYFNAFAKRFGEYEGVGQLTEEQVRHRDVSYRIVRKGRWGEILRMEAVNADGKLTASSNLNMYLTDSSDDSNHRDCRRTLVRDGQGRVVYEKAFDRDGKMVWGFVYSPPDKPLQTLGLYVGPDGFPRASVASAAEYVEINYTPQGDEGLIRYLGRNHNPLPGNDGAYGQRITYDQDGLPLTTTSLDERGEPMVNNDNFCEQSDKYDSLGNIVEETADDASGHPVPLQYGDYRRVVQFDSFGRATSMHYFDAQGRPVLSKSGIAAAIFEYDARGNIEGRETFGLDGKPIEADGYYQLHMEYDDFGNRTVWQALDAEGHPVFASTGYSEAVRRYEHDNLVAASYFDPDGKPCASPDGYASLKMTYDGANRTSEYSFDVNGNPAIDRSTGTAGDIAKFDELGHQIEVRYSGRDGKLAMCKDGYAVAKYQNDIRGNHIRTTYYDAAGMPVTARGGFAGAQNEYDERGKNTDESFFDINGRECNARYGVSHMTAKYDYHNSTVEYQSFDSSGAFVRGMKGKSIITKGFDSRHNVIWQIARNQMGQPVLDTDLGAVGFDAAFDEYNNEIERHFVDAAGNITFGIQGFARIRRRFDVRGKPIEEAYFDTADTPTVGKQGYARMTTLYNSSEQAMQVAYFGADGQPTCSRDGYAMAKYLRNPAGYLLEESYFDVLGQPTCCKSGYSLRRSSPDERGNDASVAFFGPGGAPVNDLSDRIHRYCAIFDDKDNPVEVTYFGLQGQPVACKKGFFKLLRKFDERGNQIGEAYRGINDKAVTCKDGYARAAMQYDALGQKTAGQFFDKHDQLVNAAGGYAQYRTRYNAFGDVIHEEYLDSAGGPAVNPQGWHAYDATFDDLDHAVTAISFDEQGHPFKTHAGYYSSRVEYDSFGNQVKFVACDAAGIPMRLYPATIVRTVFDHVGNPTWTAYFDVDDHPCSGTDGLHQLIRRYDPRGYKLEARYLDINAKPLMKGELGYSVMLCSVDSLGDVTSERHEGPSGQPAPFKGGYVTLHHKFDQRQNLLEESYCDADGKPMASTLSRCARLVNQYDALDDNVQTDCLDLQGKLTLGDGGYARLTREYDDAGHLTRARYFGPDLQPVISSQGFAESRMSYDANGNQIAWQCFGRDGKPMNLSSGESRHLSTFDDDRNLILDSYFDADGQPVAGGDGYAKMDRRYDDRKNIIQEHRYDAAGKPLLLKAGYYSFLKKFDQRGRLLELTTLGQGDRPMSFGDDFTTVRMTYDMLGHRTSWACFGPDGEPVTCSDGYAIVREQYDAAGKLIEEDYFDTRDQPVPMRVVIAGLVPGGRASRIGLAVGDVLLSYDGKRPQSIEQFLSARALEKAGDMAKALEVRRGSRIFRLQVTPGPIGITLDARAAAVVDPPLPEAVQPIPQTAPAATQAAVP